jgi:hypothetical protein
MLARNDETCPDVGAIDIDYVAAALAWHDGDARATIATLIGDCRHLRQQLALAEAVMSRGMGRGWRPAFDRD